MKILVIGGGGREHALVWKLAQSPKVEKIYCAPGNAGIAAQAVCMPINSDSIEELFSFAKTNQIDLTIVGPEAALTEGIVDFFQSRGLSIFGPSKKGALLEGSKSFTHEFCSRHQIPQAEYASFTDVKKACDYIEKLGRGCVVKADGLAQGKGVFICATTKEATQAARHLLEENKLGEAGSRIVIEELLVGEEASFIAISDGVNVLPLASSRDHKRIGEGDVGPNTGGMGAYSPAPIVTEAMTRRVMGEIIEPTVIGMKQEGSPFVGVLYAGLMIANNNPYLLEYNVRFGDPECQPLMVRLKSDLVDVIEKTLEGNLNQICLDWDVRPAACVVMASGGYPGSYEKGKVIFGLEESGDDIFVFHAGTSKVEENIVTSGGRVLSVTCLGDNLKAAVDRAYQRVDKISWEGAYFRKDIAAQIG